MSPKLIFCFEVKSSLLINTIFLNKCNVGTLYLLSLNDSFIKSWGWGTKHFMTISHGSSQNSLLYNQFKSQLVLPLRFRFLFTPTCLRSARVLFYSWALTVKMLTINFRTEKTSIDRVCQCQRYKWGAVTRWEVRTSPGPLAYPGSGAQRRDPLFFCKHCPQEQKVNTKAPLWNTELAAEREWKRLGAIRN